MGVDLVLEAEARVMDAEDVIVASARQLPPAVGPLQTTDLLQAGISHVVRGIIYSYIRGKGLSIHMDEKNEWEDCDQPVEPTQDQPL